MNVLFITFLILLNGLFAMSELAVVSSRRTRLEVMQERGEAGAAAALRLMERPTRFLSTVQVGITSIAMLSGIVADGAFSQSLTGWLMRQGLAEGVAPIAATALVVLVITFFTIVFGELVPKRIGQMFPEPVARWVALPMTWLALLVKPFVSLLSTCTLAVLTILRIAESDGQAMTEAEIAASLAEGVSAGLIEEREHEMVRNVFHLDDRPLTSLMLPRDEIEWLSADMTVQEALEYVSGHDWQNVHSWYPVCRGDLDNVVGIISVARLLQLGDAPDDHLQDHVGPAEFVPETLSGMEMLEQLRSKTGRVMFIVDEYGVVQGLMTPRDLLEAITGELKADAFIEAWATQLAPDRWILDGTMPISELKARLRIDRLPLEDRGRYNTLAGLLMALAGHLLESGEKIECAGWSFEVTETEGHRIDKVLAQRL